MQLQFPLSLEFKFSLFTELRVTDASGKLIAVVKEKKFSIRDEVRVFSDESRRTQTHSMKAQGLMAGALDWKAKRVIVRADGTELGALQAQGMRTMWGASYNLLGPDGGVRYAVKDDQPWMNVLEGVIDNIPLIGDAVGIGFDYLINPTYTVTDAANQPAYRVRKKRSFFSRRFTVEELIPAPAQDDELVLMALIQMILRERQRG